jgi:pSer/pThr/pTyr-binding forkhead associated (FHA) protein
MQLLVLEGPAARPTFDITQPTTLIGRAPDCDVLVFDAQVSRHHAQIVRQGDAFVVEGLQQANPVIINDRILNGRRTLVDRDLIIVGGVVLEVDIPPPPPPPTVPAARGRVGPVVAPRIEERRTPRAPALPPVPPRVALRNIAARLAEAGQRIQSRAAAQQAAYAVTRRDAPDVAAILAEHERLGGDDELARLAGLLSERLSNQTDIRALYRLGGEATVLLAWIRLAEQSMEEAVHLAHALGIS